MSLWVPVIPTDSKTSLTGPVIGWRRCGAQAGVVIRTGTARHLLA
jgi:hypothetical protein